MDLSETIIPKSDQQNFDDYLAGPRTVTISAVTKGSSEQPVNVELVEYPGRPFKPNLSMRRVLFKLWGSEGDTYVGRRMVLVGNPDVVYGGKAVGGIEIAAMSDIGPKPRTVSLTATRGRKRAFTVQPLPDAPVTGEIPADVVTTAAGAIADGKGPDYLAYLTQQGAPAEILAYVNDRIQEAAA